MTIVINSLNGKKFPSLNPVHQLPQTTTLVHNFLNFISSKKDLLMSLTTFLNSFQFLRLLDAL